MAKTLAEILAAAKSRVQRNDRKRTAKPPQGSSSWRILPGWDAANRGVFYHSFAQHYIKDAAGKVQVVMGCPRITFGDDENIVECEVCELLDQAINAAPDEKSKKMFKDMMAKQRFVLNAIHVDGPNPNEVQVLELGSQAFEQLINIMQDEDYSTLLSPERGNEIRILREGTGLDTSYSLTPRPSDKSRVLTKSDIMKAHNLAEWVSDDYNALTVKASTVIAHLSGGVTRASALMMDDAEYSSAPALPKPKDDDVALGEILDDEIPDFDGVSTTEVVTSLKTALKTAPAKPADDFAASIDDMDDIEAMLDQI